MPAAMQTRRPMPRIVPAIPHRLARVPPAARPPTPEESQHAPPTPADAHRHAPSQPDRPPPADAPWTPDSSASTPPSADADAPPSADASADADADTNTNGHGDPAAPRKRPVPAQLPPPFYPSKPSKPGTPTPSDGHQNQHQYQHQHQHQLSAGAVEFRSVNNSPPPQAQVNVQAQAHPYDHAHDRAHAHAHAHAHSILLAPPPPPPPGFAPPQHTPFFAGHAHHPSDVGAPWLSPPTADYAFADRKLPSEHGDDQHALGYATATAPAVPHLDEAAFELAAYLFTQFGNPDLADFVLQIRSADAALFSVPVHGIVVVRSPVIADAARHSPAPTHRARDARRLMDVLVSDRFVTRESLEEAVKVLYGAPLLSAQNFLFGLAPYRYDSDESGPSRDARRRMHQILSYMAAARALQMPSMHARGVDIARLLVRWDTVDLVLRYALQASPAVPSRAHRGPDAEDPFVAALLTSVIDFMAYTIPTDFQLYTLAPELCDLPRLPAFVDSQPASHNSRLSNICFGDAPPKNGIQPHHATNVLSSILVTLPLALVERLLNHRATANQLGWTGAVALMRDVIHERESRRQKVRQAQPKSICPAHVPTALLNNMYMEESVEQVEPSPLYPSGHKLVAKRLPAED